MTNILRGERWKGTGHPNATLKWKLLMLVFSGVDINSGIIVAIHLA